MREMNGEMTWKLTWRILVAWAILTILLVVGISYEMRRIQDLNATILALQQEKHATTDRVTDEDVLQHLNLHR